MRRPISSAVTLLYKNLWIFFVIVLGPILFLADVDLHGKSIYFFFWTIGIFIVWALYKDLRIVEIDEHFMYVQGGSISITIPFSVIKDVRQDLIDLQHTILIVDLKIETKLGSKIKFMPYYIFGLLFKQHPLVKELRRLANLHDN